MIPDGAATLLAFLGLVAPGLVYQLVTEKRKPRLNETAFREASRIALTSLVFTLFALIGLGLVWRMWSHPFPSLTDWEANGWAYVAAHPLRSTWPLVATIVLSCSLAAAAAWRTSRDSLASFADHGVWHQVLRLDAPQLPKTRPLVHLKLKDETELWGHIRYHTGDDSADVREIALGGPALAWQRKGESAPVKIGALWDVVVVEAESISFLRVVYQETTKRGGQYHYRGRRTDSDQAGRKMS